MVDPQNDFRGFIVVRIRLWSTNTVYGNMRYA